MTNAPAGVGIAPPRAPAAQVSPPRARPVTPGVRGRPVTVTMRTTVGTPTTWVTQRMPITAVM